MRPGGVEHQHVDGPEAARHRGHEIRGLPLVGDVGGELVASAPPTSALWPSPAGRDDAVELAHAHAIGHRPDCEIAQPSPQS
jgi:hypothetical protein